MSRTLSYTEVSTALTCFAKWDFSYGGRLAGATLRPRETAPILSDGRAWGAAVAAWHAHSGELFAEQEAMLAIVDSLYADADEMRRKGYEPDLELMLDQQTRLIGILGHYVATAEQLPNLSQLEGELNVAIPSRGGKRGSNRYRFHCYLDGHSQSDHPWIVEFKLRKGLTPRAIVERQPQYRWYALAYALTTGTKGPVGVLLDERLNEMPLPPRIVNGSAKEKAEPAGHGSAAEVLDWIDHVEECGTRRPSDDAKQHTTAELYLAACAEHRHEPNRGTVEALRARTWQQRIPLIFTPEDLREAADELTGAAKLIRDLDSGALFPIRNGSRGTCQSCRFAGVCMEPTNHFLINSMFERTEPKRLRGPRPEGVR